MTAGSRASGREPGRAAETAGDDHLKEGHERGRARRQESGEATEMEILKSATLSEAYPE